MKKTAAKIQKKTASKGSKGSAKGAGGKGYGPASVSVMKKVNWMNRAGLFGKDLVDEDALEMLGNLPTERGMSILDNMEAKADAGEIWNPNSYIVKAVIRHTKEIEASVNDSV